MFSVIEVPPFRPSLGVSAEVSIRYKLVHDAYVFAYPFFCKGKSGSEVEKMRVKWNNNNNNNNFIFSPQNIQERKIYNNSTDNDRGAGCPK